MLSGGTDKLSYFVNAYGATKAEWNTPKGKIPYVERDQQNFYARFDYDFLPEHALSLEYTYNETSHKTGGKGYQHEDVGFFFKKIWDIDPALLHAAYLSYEGSFSDWFSLYATFGGGKNDLEYQYGYNGFDEKTPLDDYLGGTNYTTMGNDFLYGEIRGTMNFLSEDRLRIITGISYKSTDVDFIAKHKEPKRAFDYSETETYISSYIQAEYKPIDYAMFVTGIRYDEYSYEKSSKKDATSSRFGISLFPFAHTNYDWTTLWSSYSEAFNPPVPGFLQTPKRMGSNPDLKPEKIRGWEFGLKQRLGRWASLETSYFDTDYDDLIARLKHVPGGLGGYYDNIDEANLKGWEFMCEIYPLDWLILHFGYSDLEKKNRKTGKKMNPMMTPDTILNYGVSIVDLYGFSGSIWGRQYQNYKNPSFHQKTMGNNQPSEGKIVWDMKILYHWDIKEGLTCEPFVTVHNLSNETYYVGGYNYNLMEERTYQAGISFKMDF